MEVNDFIFKELIKRGYSVEGKTRVWNIADSKLWYQTPEQAKAFIEMEEKDPVQKKFVKKEIDLIKENFDKLVSDVVKENLNIVDLGCGDGDKAFAFLNKFKEKSSIKYYPIDINKFMVEEAFKNVSKISGLKVVKSDYNLSDFFDLDDIAKEIKKDNFKTNFLLLLGGNLENSDMHDLLHDIRNAMKDSDFLLVGNRLNKQKIRPLIKYYQRSRQIDNLLIKTLTEIGFDASELEYDARYRGQRVEMFYRLKRDKVLECCGKKVLFREGDKIIVAISYKYTKDSLMEALNMYFDDVEIFESNNKDYALALCKK